MADPMLTTRRAWRLLWVLQGNTFEGLRLTQVAKALECSPTVALRLLEAAAEEGVAERRPDALEQWRLTPRIVRLAFAHQQEVDRVQRRVSELGQRYTTQD